MPSISKVVNKAIPVNKKNIICYLQNQKNLSKNTLEKIKDSDSMYLNKIDKLCGKILAQQKKSEKAKEDFESKLKETKFRKYFFDFDETDKLTNTLSNFYKTFDGQKRRMQSC